MTQEPTWRIVFMVVLAHAAALCGGWWWLTYPHYRTARDQVPALRWFSPRDIATPLAQPVSTEMLVQPSSGSSPVKTSPPEAPVSAPPSADTPGKPKLEVTLSHKTVVFASGVDMTGVDRAIVDEFRRNWVLPADFETQGMAREVLMDVVIVRDGHVKTCMLAKPSGHSTVDMAALRAADLVIRIPTPLPPQFLGDSYEVQLHFRAQ